jgi:hypothetical protein
MSLETRGAHMGPITHAAAINPIIADFLAAAPKV